MEDKKFGLEVKICEIIESREVDEVQEKIAGGIADIILSVRKSESWRENQAVYEATRKELEWYGYSIFLPENEMEPIIDLLKEHLETFNEGLTPFQEQRVRALAAENNMSFEAYWLKVLDSLDKHDWRRMHRKGEAVMNRRQEVFETILGGSVEDGGVIILEPFNIRSIARKVIPGGEKNTGQEILTRLKQYVEGDARLLESLANRMYEDLNQEVID